MKILFIADAFAAAGRRIIEERLPPLRTELGVDFVVANAENVADGVGITSRIAKKLFEAGVDVITLGNHAYRQREVYPYLDQEPRILRPANYPDTRAGARDAASPRPPTGRGWRSSTSSAASSSTPP